MSVFCKNTRFEMESARMHMKDKIDVQVKSFNHATEKNH